MPEIREGKHLLEQEVAVPSRLKMERHSGRHFDGGSRQRTMVNSSKLPAKQVWQELASYARRPKLAKLFGDEPLAVMSCVQDDQAPSLYWFELRPCGTETERHEPSGSLDTLQG